MIEVVKMGMLIDLKGGYALVSDIDELDLNFGENQSYKLYGTIDSLQHDLYLHIINIFGRSNPHFVPLSLTNPVKSKINIKIQKYFQQIMQN